MKRKKFEGKKFDLSKINQKDIALVNRLKISVIEGMTTIENYIEYDNRRN